MKGYDYSKAGLYFITFRVQNGRLLFGTIENGEMILNDAGKMIQTEWEKLPRRFNNMELHEFVVMPNHFHGIVQIVPPVGAPLVGAQNSGAHDDVDHDDVDHDDVDHDDGAHDDVDHDDGAHRDGNDGITHADDGTPIDGRAPTRGAPTNGSPGHSVGEMMGSFKSITTVEYINGVKNLGWKPFAGKLWQRNFYEHIIRIETADYKISDYIFNNPIRWKEDKFYKR